jgi:hypothetical protein
VRVMRDCECVESVSAECECESSMSVKVLGYGISLYAFHCVSDGFELRPHGLDLVLCFANALTCTNLL